MTVVELALKAFINELIDEHACKIYHGASNSHDWYVTTRDIIELAKKYGIETDNGYGI